MKFSVRNIFMLAALAISVIACKPEEKPDNGSGNSSTGGSSTVKEDVKDDAYYTKYYANYFACNAMGVYYLWYKEVSDKLNSWSATAEPIEKVAEVRYKDSKGKDIDKWTRLTDDFKSFTSSVQGVSTTYGATIKLYRASDTNNLIYAVIKYVSAGSPAAEAGLKRGDTIISVNGTAMDTNNYYDLITTDFLYSATTSIGLLNGKKVSMTAVEMYEDPVLVTNVFDCGGKKVGYLCFTSFTLKAYERLIEVCTDFKSQGVSELILDLRDNGGGYVITEQTLASMLAPQAAVDAEEVFEKDIYNDKLAEYYDTDTKFTKSYSMTLDGKNYTYTTDGANIGISKIYAILTGNSASASESILVGLKPYLDVEIIGEQSYGKYCTGQMLSASSWFDAYKNVIKADDYTQGKKYTDNWGLYVMISRYADKNGETPCMPDGFTPDVEATDKPYESYQLGDEREAMLRVALQRAGKTDLAPLDSKANVAALHSAKPLPFDSQIHPAGFGLRIVSDSPVALGL